MLIYFNYKMETIQKYKFWYINSQQHYLIIKRSETVAEMCSKLMKLNICPIEINIIQFHLCASLEN